jgi:UDP-N-acetylmuramoylalanine--D-glutamate ligase
MENYVRAKFRILQNQTPQDAFIYWHDDPVITAQLEQYTIEARQYPFAEHFENMPNTAAYVDNTDNLVVETGGTSLSMPRADLSLNGLHNLYNSMAAALSACLLNIRRDDIRRSLSDFEGVEHRLEYVTTIDGVRYINDSKATNVNSTWYALESMTTPTVLILGGKDKGNDYSEILPLVKQKVKAIVAMGLHNEKIIDFFGDVVPVTSTDSLDAALAAAKAAATAGDTVLLSPCCASFDLFKSYEDRGTRFKNAVRALS